MPLRLLIVACCCSSANALTAHSLVGAPTAHSRASARCGQPRSLFGRRRKQDSAASASAPQPVAPPQPGIPKATASEDTPSRVFDEQDLAPSRVFDEQGLAPAADALSDALSPILTLENREDGWDDVREALRSREKPWQELKKSVMGISKSPAVRWAKVLSDEAAEALGKK